MLFNGSSVTLNSTAIYGLTTHPYRATDTATNYGGGDWGTATNVKGHRGRHDVPLQRATDSTARTACLSPTPSTSKCW